MNELKVYVPQDGAYGLLPEEGGYAVEEETCYLKSEADKVISHEKYKRCLAMADKCEAWIRLDVSPRHTHRFIRRHKIWLAIAEKFKEAK